MPYTWEPSFNLSSPLWHGNSTHNALSCVIALVHVSQNQGVTICKGNLFKILVEMIKFTMVTTAKNDSHAKAGCHDFNSMMAYHEFIMVFVLWKTAQTLPEPSFATHTRFTILYIKRGRTCCESVCVCVRPSADISALKEISHNLGNHWSHFFFEI